MGKDFRVCYCYEDRNGNTFVVLERRGRHYTRPCKLDGFGCPSFRFLGVNWFTGGRCIRLY